MRWLIPRLSSFHAANAGIEVLLTASLDEVDFRREDIDGAIRLGDGKWSGANAYRLVPNILLPVCSPALAKQVRKPADLQRQVLLHSIARPEDWGFWLASTGADKLVDARSGMTYQSSAMAYMAALEGQGFAIAQRFLVEDDLTSGKLVHRSGRPSTWATSPTTCSRRRTAPKAPAWPPSARGCWRSSRARQRLGAVDGPACVQRRDIAIRIAEVAQHGARMSPQARGLHRRGIADGTVDREPRHADRAERGVGDIGEHLVGRHRGCCATFS